MEKNIADKAARWLAEKETGKPIRECFGEAPFAYRDWLLIPGEKQNPRLPEGAEEEWNALLLDVFARTAAYRKSETVLWDRLERLAQTLRRTSEKEKGVALVLRDNQALFPPPPLIGREAELLEIHGILEAKGRLLLWGMAGIGKSALARAYGARYRDTYASILLIPCECGLRKALVDDGLVNISGLRYLPRGKRAEQGWYLRKKLACVREITDSRTLLILDNLDPKDPYLEKLQSLPCRLLITSRTAAPDSGLPQMRVTAVTDHLLSLFEAYAGQKAAREEEPLILRLADTVYGNTLLIKNLAGQYRESGKSLQNFLEGADVSGPDLFGLSALSPKEQQLLREASLLPLFGIPLEEFARYASCASQSRVESLARRGLLEYSPAAGRISLHPLVKEQIRRLLKPDCSSCSAYLSAFARRLKGYWNFPAREKEGFRQQILSVLTALPEPKLCALDSLFVLADLLWQMGEWDAAEAYVRRLYRFCLDTVGAVHPLSAAAANLTASVFYNRGRFSQAALWHQKTWEAYAPIPDKEPFYEALYLVKYSRCFRWRGDEKTADACLDRAESIYEKAIREAKDPETYQCALVNYYIERCRQNREQNRPKKALAWCEKADALSKKLGGRPATRAYLLHDAALLLRCLGETEKSLSRINEAMDCARLALSPDSPEFLEISRDWKKMNP